MNDARASHINAKQGTIKAVKTSKLGQRMGRRSEAYSRSDRLLRVLTKNLSSVE
jgi:hypothetical protein